MSLKSTVKNYLGEPTKPPDDEVWEIQIYDAITMEEVAIIENATSDDVDKNLERSPQIYYVEAFCGSATCDNQETNNDESIPF